MNHGRAGVPLIAASDPVERSALELPGVQDALDRLGAAIVAQAPGLQRTVSGPPRRLLSKPRAAAVVGTAIVVTGTTAAAASVLSARTGLFQPSQSQIAKANPQQAARMRSELAMGGPGEELKPAAPDFRQVALQISSDITYPQGYQSWRDFVFTGQLAGLAGPPTQSGTGGLPAQATEVSSGAVHGFFADSAFCAWVQSWRQADIAGNKSATSHAAKEIAGALNWKAVTAEDPHPNPSIPGDLGTTTSTRFGWMIAYRDAVLAGDRPQVEKLLASGYGFGKCWLSDPDWMAEFGAHPQWRALSPQALAAKYEQFLTSERP